MKGSSGTGNATRMHSKPSSLCIALCRRPRLLWFQVCQRRSIPERLRTLQAAVCSCSFLVIWFSVFSGYLVSSYLNRPYRAYQCRRECPPSWLPSGSLFLLQFPNLLFFLYLPPYRLSMNYGISIQCKNLLARKYTMPPP
ncbi:hypothetical protein QR685DRAFT_275662 [Neurospora intermedia]|uniref:Uncharacterized protein n=1 Tax=Neurospora intermedia TaxID=5142 RepID=A0ABR3DEP2_NEUIN